MEEQGSRELDPKVRGSWSISVNGLDRCPAFPKYPLGNPQQKLVTIAVAATQPTWLVSKTVTVPLSLKVSARSFHANGHFSSSSREAGSAQPENTALVSLGWSEGTMGASPEDCRQTDGRLKR